MLVVETPVFTHRVLKWLQMMTIDSCNMNWSRGLMSETSFVGAAVCGRFDGQQQAAGNAVAFVSSTTGLSFARSFLCF